MAKNIMKKKYFCQIDFGDPSLISLGSPSYPNFPVLIFPLKYHSLKVARGEKSMANGYQILVYFLVQCWKDFRRQAYQGVEVYTKIPVQTQ